MTRNRLRRLGYLSAWTLAVSALPAGRAGAQLYTPDPFHAFSRNYLPYAYPGAGDPTGLPGVAQGRPAVAANQFQTLGDVGRFDDRFRNSVSLPGREYIPNAQVDKVYLEAREKRRQALDQALAERDPKKRAEMLRAAERDARKAASDTSLSRRRSPSGAAPRATSAPGGTSGRRAAAGAAGSPTTRPAPSAPARPTPGGGMTDPAEALERSRARGEVPLTSPRRSLSTPPPRR